MRNIKRIIALTGIVMMGMPMWAQTEFKQLPLDEALSVAKQENKKVFIDFYTDWCGPCKKMAKEVFPQRSVGDFMNSSFVCLKMNAEKEGKDLAKRYEVKAYPTYIVLNANGEVLMDAKGFMSADAFIAKMQSGLDPEKSPKRLEERYLLGERTPELVNAYALYLMEQRKEEEGFNVVNGYFDGLSDAERLSADNLFLYTRYTLDVNDAKAQYLIENRDKFQPEQKKAVDKRIQELCRNEVVGYFSGYRWSSNQYVEADYQKLKEKILSLKLDKTYPYRPMFELIECRVKSDDSAFLDACQKEFSSLAPVDRDLLIMNMSRLIKSKDQMVLKNASSFIRSHLSELRPDAIVLAGRVLAGFEE